MARVTVEDSLSKVENRFELVLVASKRARQIANGKEAKVPLENDKPTVVALREIAEGHMTKELIEKIANEGNEEAETGEPETAEGI